MDAGKVDYLFQEGDKFVVNQEGFFKGHLGYILNRNDNNISDPLVVFLHRWTFRPFFFKDSQLTKITEEEYTLKLLEL